jgi:hypothetical protein
VAPIDIYINYKDILKLYVININVLYGKVKPRVLFSSRQFFALAIVELSFVFDNYYLIID